MGSSTTVVILAAGKGTRMKSATPKVLQPLLGRPMLAWVLDAARALDPAKIVLVLGHQAAEVEAAARGLVGDVAFEAVIQEPQHGTGHAVQVAASALGHDPGEVVVLYGDMPLLRGASLCALVDARRDLGPGGLALLVADADDPRGYGRILRDAQGDVVDIVEQKDATGEQLDITEINPGVYAFDGAALLADLPRLTNANAQGEYYLTDLLALAVAAGRSVADVAIEPLEALGVNTLEQLAEVRAVLQFRVLEQHLANGVRIEDPHTTFIDHGVEIGADTTILPCTVIRAGVRIGAGCEVGPFAHLRVGTTLADAAVLGNFCESKHTTLGPGSKAKHLTYLGNAEIGARTNIGAGTVFANYDGRAKHTTEVGAGVFIGSGTIIVAPNKLPDGVMTAAGAVVTRSAVLQPNEVWAGLPARRLRARSE